jgi:hypothetical protein
MMNPPIDDIEQAAMILYIGKSSPSLAERPEARHRRTLHRAATFGSPIHALRDAGAFAAVARRFRRQPRSVFSVSIFTKRVSK